MFKAKLLCILFALLAGLLQANTSIKEESSNVVI